MPSSTRLSSVIGAGCPCFLHYQDRLFIHYNNNTQSRPNPIFRVELDRYVAGTYAFDAAPPFRPRRLTQTPILRPEDEAPYSQPHRRRNPMADGIVFPAGALPWAGGRWLVSYGLHDERCCLRLVELPDPQEDCR